MKIVVPLAGSDPRFERAGDHKALTQVFGKPVIRWVMESRPYDLASAIFILLREHDRRFRIQERLEVIFGKSLQVVWAETMTGGAPQSVLLARDMIDGDSPLLIDLLDQHIDFRDLVPFLRATDADGVIPTFESLYSNRGYMILDPGTRRVLRVSEKDAVPISTHSTACVSWFRRGSDFVRAADAMIAAGHVAANGTYMVSMVFNELIQEGRTVLAHPCEFIATLGSPEGLACFEQLVRPVVYPPEFCFDD